jgi:hypothetical protein
MKLKKGDKVIFSVIAVFFLAITIYTFFYRNTSGITEAVIEIDGELYKRIQLSENMPKEDIHIRLDNGKHFQIIVEKGKVWMNNSTCPNQICVKTGAISKKGESIICLPYKTAIYIEEKGVESH